MRKRVRWLAVALTGVWGVAAHGAIYVSPAGDHSDGSDWSKAYTNVQTALDAASPADTIRLAGGQYVLGAELVWPAVASLTLEGGYEGTGAPGNRDPAVWETVLTRTAATTNRLLNIQAVENPTVIGLSFENGLSTAGTGGSLYALNATNLVIRDCRFVRNRATGTQIYGGALHASACDGLMSNVWFIGNTAATGTGGSDVSRGGGAYITGGEWLIRDTVFSGNVLTGRNGDGGGLYLHSGTHTVRNVLIANNRIRTTNLPRGTGFYADTGLGATVLENATVRGNTGASSTGVTGPGLTTLSANLTVRNSIFMDNLTDFAGTCTVTQNCFYGGQFDGVAGNFKADPLFEHPLYFLSPGSPCVDAGDRTVAEAGVAGLTTQTNGTADTGAVDLGFHHPAGLGVDLTLYVNPATGDDGNSGTVGSPLKSIAKALDLAVTRTRIMLAPGNYVQAEETFPLVIRNKSVHLIGTNAALTVIDAAGAGQRVLEIHDAPTADIRIEGLTLTGGQIPEFGAGLYVAYSAVRIERSRIRRNSVTAFSSHGAGLYAVESSGWMDDVEFYANQVLGTTGAGQTGHGGGLHLLGGGWHVRNSVVVANNIYVRNPSGAGVYLEGGVHRFFNALVAFNRGRSADAQPHAVYVALGGAAELENCTIAGHSWEGLRAMTTNVTVRHSILHDNGADVIGTTALHDNFIGDGTLAGVNGNITGDPRFETPLYYLAPDSPCVDAGAWSAAAAGLDGRTTFTNGAADTGAVNLGYHFAEGLGIDVELFVDAAAGDDGNPGTSGSPLKTITKALQMAGERTRIHLAAGSYVHGVETFPLAFAGRTVQIAGTNRALTVVNAAGSSKRVFQVSDSPLGDNRLERLTIQGGGGPPPGIGVYALESALTLRDCAVVSNVSTSANPSHGAGMYGVRSAVLVEDVVFDRNRANASATSGHTAYGGAISIHAGHWTIRRVAMIGNVAYARNTYGAGMHMDAAHVRMRNTLLATNWLYLTASPQAYQGAALSQEFGVLDAENVTVASNTSSVAASVAAWRRGTYGDVSVRHAIFWNNEADFQNVPAADIWYSSSTQLTEGVQGNTNAAPDFADETYFHLNSTEGYYAGGYFTGGTWQKAVTHSPLIDAGDPDSDYSLEPFPNGGRVNMGAYGNTAVASKSAAAALRGTVIWLR